MKKHRNGYNLHLPQEVSIAGPLLNSDSAPSANNASFHPSHSNSNGFHGDYGRTNNNSINYGASGETNYDVSCTGDMIDLTQSSPSSITKSFKLI